MTIVRYKKPRETVGQYLAENYRCMGWDVSYNSEQKEFWYKEADKLLLKLKQWRLY